MSGVSIHVENVVFGYRKRPVLKRLSWDLGPGFVGLLGPNGAGKTTLINCLVGLTTPDSGSIEIAQGRAAIGYVQQRSAAPGHMRVRDAIEYSAWLQGVPSAELADAASEAVSLLGLDDLARRRFRTLSGGERQRVVIAAAVSHRPSILVLDEPTVGLDPSHRLAVRRAIKGLTHLECVLISTHLIEDVEHLCSHVGVLADGQIRFSGTVSALLSRYSAREGETTFGSAFETAYEDLVNPTVTPE